MNLTLHKSKVVTAFIILILTTMTSTFTFAYGGGVQSITNQGEAFFHKQSNGSISTINTTMLNTGINEHNLSCSNPLVRCDNCPNPVIRCGNSAK
jgi:hypothetical protein